MERDLIRVEISFYGNNISQIVIFKLGYHRYTLKIIFNMWFSNVDAKSLFCYKTAENFVLDLAAVPFT